MRDEKNTEPPAIKRFSGGLSEGMRNRFIGLLCVLLMVEGCASFNKSFEKARQATTDEAKIQEYTEAIKHWNAKNGNETLSKAYYQRGLAYLNKKLYDKAIPDFTKAIDLDSGNVIFYSNRGAAYASKGLYDEAIQDLTKAIEIDPNDSVSYSNRGKAYASRGLLNFAIEDLSKAIKLSPKKASLYQSRAVVYRMMGQADLADSDLKRAEELSRH